MEHSAYRITPLVSNDCEARTHDIEVRREDQANDATLGVAGLQGIGCGLGHIDDWKLLHRGLNMCFKF